MEFQQFDGPYLERLRSGDFTTQQHFFAYFDRLIRIKVSQRLYSNVAIEDVRQETFARVLRSLSEDRIREPGRLGAFVNSVCNNVLLEHYRLACREIPTADGFADAIPDRTLEASDQLAQRQVQQQVRQVLDELSEKDRGLIKALFLEERDKDEVCRYFGVDREYLRVLVHRAKQSFKSRYVNKFSMERRVRSVGLSSPSKAPARTVSKEAFVPMGAPTFHRI
jgi:RNA polymerase sigma-70 factor (ECF subfamily)